MAFSPPPGDFAVDNSRSVARVDIQSVMRLVYIWMGLGLLTTAVVAVVVASSEALMMLTLNPVVRIGTFIGTFALVIALSAGLTRQWLSTNMAAALFFVYAALMGFLFSVILVAFDMAAISSAFFTTVVVFGVMSVFGYTTKMDLTKWGTYLTMGLIALIVVMIINIFLNSSGLSMLISLAGVVIFTALTAYDTQKIKEMTQSYEVQSDGNLAFKFSVYGALMLYLDFINLFLFLLRLFGGARD